MACNNCNENQHTGDSVPQLAFESMKATLERTIRRLWILALVLIFVLLGTNAAWLYYESQWEDERSTEISQKVDTETGDAVFAGIGDAYYSKDSADG